MVLLQTGIINISQLAESVNLKDGRDSVSTYMITKWIRGVNISSPSWLISSPSILPILHIIISVYEADGSPIALNPSFSCRWCSFVCTGWSVLVFLVYTMRGTNNPALMKCSPLSGEPSSEHWFYSFWFFLMTLQVIRLFTPGFWFLDIGLCWWH